MSALRPIGFRPSEISSLVNTRVVECHVSEAAFLWMQRNRAVRAPHYRLKHLAMLDSRVDAHLEGLSLGGEVAWAAAQEQLADCDPGNVFVSVYLAFASGRADRMRAALFLGLSEPAFQDALVSALAWLNGPNLKWPLERLANSPKAIHQLIAISVLSACRIDAGSVLASAAQDDNEVLRARALRSIGELKRRDLIFIAQQAEMDASVACRFWANRSLALLGISAAAQRAYEAGQQEPMLVGAALEVAMRCGETDWARSVVRKLASVAETHRLAVQATGSLGDPASVPWLLNHMSDPRMARVCGEAFSMITGADFDYLAIKQDTPPESPEDEDPEDTNLPWPDTGRVSAWWSAECGRFATGSRYLAGLPVTRESVMQVLRNGYQRQRHAAALELARLNEAAMVFPVAARASWQKRRLAT